MKIPTVFILGGGLILTSLGYAQQTPARPGEKGAAARAETSSEASRRGQARLMREVRHELVMLPYYGVFDHLAYRVDGGTVTLLGQVSRPTLKSSAENVVKDIEGVERVVNNIEVLPVSSHDDNIRLAAYRAIYGHSNLNRYALQAVPPMPASRRTAYRAPSR
jgi:hyperosmotically inducible protein